MLQTHSLKSVTCDRARVLKKSLMRQKRLKLGDQKCIPNLRKSFIGHSSGSVLSTTAATEFFNTTRLITNYSRRSVPNSLSLWRDLPDDTTPRWTVGPCPTLRCRAVEITIRVEDHAASRRGSIAPPGEVVQVGSYPRAVGEC